MASKNNTDLTGNLFDKQALESLKGKKAKFKQSGHYIDQKLKHAYDAEVKNQPSVAG